eukprot:CAMPEP_0180792714 /NCGR_PEP_ID=MMETSP1038_2-20121128/54569_1 /TAXON_ID=632150 /ORGANISM="Azadinium spinosum, Strain 3D9" /LENGTH=54 /DNA_ID=CAMNT_0022831097 /DNA_START=26 /DNA_END=187 /DNA_ORIENTATION=+
MSNVASSMPAITSVPRRSDKLTQPSSSISKPIFLASRRKIEEIVFDMAVRKSSP